MPTASPRRHGLIWRLLPTVTQAPVRVLIKTMQLQSPDVVDEDEEGEAQKVELHELPTYLQQRSNLGLAIPNAALELGTGLPIVICWPGHTGSARLLVERRRYGQVVAHRGDGTALVDTRHRRVDHHRILCDERAGRLERMLPSLQ